MRLQTLIIMVLALTAITPMAMAQTASGSDLVARMALAQKMHEIRPMSVQIEQAVTQLAERYPEDRRELFINKMLQTFDQKTLTDISVRAMAETFTVPELEKMVDFYGSPEGKAVTEKMPVYQAIVEPEVVKKIDAALMEIRTGAPGTQP